MGNNWDDLAIRQQFRVDFRMTPNTFMDTFSLVRNIGISFLAHKKHTPESAWKSA